MQDHHGRDHTLYVGVDIAATTATAAWIALDTPMSAPVTVAQTMPGYAALCAKLATTGVTPGETLVVLEATGSYWITLATTLVERGYHVSVVNPAVWGKKKRRDWLKAHAARHADWLLFEEDDWWCSRFAQPTVHAWAQPGQELRLVEREAERNQQQALACYGAVRHDTNQVCR